MENTMILKIDGIQEEMGWGNAQIKLPRYDVPKMIQDTTNNPIWLHFGAGNIFRGYIAKLQQELLDRGLSEKGIIVAETFDYDIVSQIYEAYDNLALFVGLLSDGSNQMSVIASIAEAIKADFEYDKAVLRLQEIAVNPSLQMVSFTITEKGYGLHNMDGQLLEVVSRDISKGPKNPKHTMSVVTAFMYTRFKTTKAPIALVSMDNCSHNGDKLKQAVLFIAQKWMENGFVEADFINYLEDEQQVSFPWSMIDKITPRPDLAICHKLETLGVEKMQPVTTSKNTFIAPFVNAEMPEYLVIEDRFPNGRPPLEEVGVYFGDRRTVDLVERMKVTTCLNPLHTALAIYGCLLGYTKISDEMKDEDLRNLVEKMGYKEGLKVVLDPIIINPERFLGEVLKERLTNPFLPDTPQRIATDTSQKVGIRFGETIKAYTAKGEQETLIYIPLVIAGWLRYLLGFDDSGREMELSSDPMLEDLRVALSGIQLYQANQDLSGIRKILSNQLLFGVDLCENHMDKRILDLFSQMIQKDHAVRETLHKYVFTGIDI